MEYVVPQSRVIHYVIALMVTVGTLGACRAERVEPTSCVPGTAQGSWVEDRTPGSAASDSAPASLAVTLTTTLDSLDRLPEGAMISLLIAGPRGAERPDTVRLLTAEVPGGPLWSGTDLRPGTYAASLTTNGFAAGPREFTLAPGERLRLAAAMGRVCEAPSR